MPDGWVHRELFLEHYSEHRHQRCPGKSCSQFQSLVAAQRRVQPPPIASAMSNPRGFVEWASRSGRAWLQEHGTYVHDDGPEHHRDDLQTIAIKVMVEAYDVDGRTRFFTEVQDLARNWRPTSVKALEPMGQSRLALMGTLPDD